MEGGVVLVVVALRSGSATPKLLSASGQKRATPVSQSSSKAVLQSKGASGNNFVTSSHTPSTALSSMSGFEAISHRSCSMEGGVVLVVVALRSGSATPKLLSASGQKRATPMSQSSSKAVLQSKGAS